MGLDVALVDGLRGVLPLDNDIRLREPLLEVAALELDVAADVADDAGVGAPGEAHDDGPGGEGVVEERGVVLHGVADVEDGGKHLVVDVDERKGLFCDVVAGCGHGGDGVPLVERLGVGETVLREHAGVALGLAKVDGLALDDGKSREVATALTPGRASALLVSMLRMRAWGCGLRRILPCSNPGMLISAPYLALPVTLSRPS